LRASSVSRETVFLTTKLVVKRRPFKFSRTLSVRSGAVQWCSTTSAKRMQPPATYPRS